MLKLTNKNYHGTVANIEYWSVSQFKAFDKCEAAGLAAVRGEYERESTVSLMVGSYIDAFFSGDMSDFIAEHPEIFNSRTGELKADYRKADDIISYIQNDPLMTEYLTGAPQTIMTGELFGVPWKIKSDFLRPERIVDLKIVKDFEPIFQDGFGWRPWVEYWGYDIQGAIYQEIIRQNTGERLPFYLVAATKEKNPDKDVIQITQPVLDAAMKIVEAKIDRFDLIKTGEIEPKRCESCDYCKQTKILTAPSIYERENYDG